MKERGMLYTRVMILALLARVKLETRRVIAFEDLHPDFGVPHPEEAFIDNSYMNSKSGMKPCLKVPYGEGDSQTVQSHFPKWNVGDTIWAKETFFDFTKFKSAACFAELPGNIAYRADETFIGCHRWTPSIFMPRSASRITREVTAVRAERVQAISERDAQAEGSEFFADIDFSVGRTYREVYRRLWNSINLQPSPIYFRGTDKVWRIVGYRAFPWSIEDFELKYPGAIAAGTYRGLPLTVFPNSWVWVVQFREQPIRQAQGLDVLAGGHVA